MDSGSSRTQNLTWTESVEKRLEFFQRIVQKIIDVVVVLAVSA